MVSTANFDQVFSQLIAEAKQSAQHSSQQSPSAQLGLTDPITGVGTAHEDRITVTMADGRLTACELQPQAMRLSNVALGEQIVHAVNAAIEQYQQALSDAMAQQQPDLAATPDALREIQYQATDAVRKHTQAMLDMLSRVEGR